MNIKAALLALLAYGIFSTHDVVVKYVSAEVSAFQIVFFSSLLSFPLLTLMMVRDAIVRDPGKKDQENQR